MRTSGRHYLSLQTIEEVAYGGYGIARPGGKVVFVENALPGELVDVVVTKKKKDHSFGRVAEYWRRSPDRIGAFCRHFATCGGCTRQDLPYQAQLAIKTEYVRQALQRIAKISDPPIEPILACDQDARYRNKLDFSFTPTRWLEDAEIASAGRVDRRGLGFHVPGRFDRVLDIETCYLQPEPSNRIRRWVRNYARAADLSFYDPHRHEGLLRSLIVRTSLTGETMVVLVFGSDDQPAARSSLLAALAEAFPELTCIAYIVNTTGHDAVAGLPAHTFAGRDFIYEACGPLRFRIHPESFYQTNPAQAVRLYEVVRDWAALTGTQRVFDLFCGVGSIGLYLADAAASVVGVESVAASVAGARENAQENGISNATFVQGSVEDVFSASFLEEQGRPDLVVVDPPRSGLHGRTCELLSSDGPPRILYVSCNPSTQARDLLLMESAYRLDRIRPVDMFPQTHHIETVALLTRRG